MIRHCRTTAVAMVLAGFAVSGFAVFGFAASAHAQPNDQQFIERSTPWVFQWAQTTMCH